MLLRLLNLVESHKVALKRHKRHLRPLNRNKLAHSIAVARRLHKAGADQTAIDAGLLHDVSERGGDAARLYASLPAETTAILKALHVDETDAEGVENLPLVHLREALPQLPSTAVRNFALLVKLADRVDNLWKRRRVGKVGKNYRRKSHELLEFIADEYSGRHGPFRRLWRKAMILLRH